MSNSKLGGDEIREESSWRYALSLFVATLVLCAVLLYYYVGPRMEEIGGNVPSPVVSEERVNLAIGDARFSIPANFTVYPRDRRGGVRDEVYLYALWPTFSGYSAPRRNEFVENSKNTRRLDLTISKRTTTFGEKDRIEKLYLPQTKDRNGVFSPHQLRQYVFNEQSPDVPTNGYSGYELYIGETEDEGRIALFCQIERDEIAAPYCWREYETAGDVTIIYRFKKPYLAEWRNIDREVRTFIGTLKQE